MLLRVRPALPASAQKQGLSPEGGSYTLWSRLQGMWGCDGMLRVGDQGSRVLGCRGVGRTVCVCVCC